METIFIVLGILLLLALFILGNLFALARIASRTRRAWGELEEEVRKKIMIASEILEEIMRYAAYERDLVREIAKAKKRAEEADTYEEKKESGSVLSAVLRSAFKVSENYPDLKASQKFMRLKDELGEIEEGISSARTVFEEAISALKKVFKQRRLFSAFSFFKGKKEKEVVDEKPKKGKVIRRNKNKQKKI